MFAHYEILLKKLQALGFSDKCIQCERIFFIEIENQLTDCGKVSCGVPQGSILGPLLFLVYVSNMPQAVKSNYFYILSTHASCNNKMSKKLKNS